MTKPVLARLELYGFKSIKSLPELRLGRMNVLIGANGAGKSNFISFFKLLNRMTISPGNLQFHVSKSGGAHVLLHDGPEVTPQISASFLFKTKLGTSEYHMRLSHAAQDTLIFAEEKFRFSDSDSKGWASFGSGHRESYLAKANFADDYGDFVFLKQCAVYQFHNTSETARIRQKWDVNDGRFLKEDGGNLAPFLLRLRESEPAAYLRIVETIRQVAPYFADFVLEPDHGTVLLQWRERGSDLVFGPNQASDGTLRAMALIALLLQPSNDLPAVIILDEPELGLHPFAIQIVAGLLRSVSSDVLVILATQSMTLVDQFEPEEVIIVERSGRESTFRRLDSEKLKDWMTDYSLSELWEKNVIGGRPSV